MIVVSSSLVGETVTITLYVYDADDNLTDSDGWLAATPTGPIITIRKGETKFVANTVDEVAMDRESLGTFEYKWQTAGEKPGPYTITCCSEVDGEIRTPQKTFRLVSPGTP